VKLQTLEALLADREARRPVVLLTWLESGDQRLVHAARDLSEDAILAEAVEQALTSDRAAAVESASGRVFVQPYNPPLRLVIVGAVHIAQHLADWALRLGHAVSVVDPRTSFASPSRFPGVRLLHDWPDAALDAIGLDARCAVVTLSHDPKLDDPALERALHSEAFYIGALGSQRTQARRRERLRAQGFDDAAIARVHGPVGLDLGARSPAEIALSIAAQLTESLRRPLA
jgi:xanthine dehydrogenase accessory factor